MDIERDLAIQVSDEYELDYILHRFKEIGIPFVSMLLQFSHATRRRAELTLRSNPILIIYDHKEGYADYSDPSIYLDDLPFLESTLSIKIVPFSYDKRLTRVTDGYIEYSYPGGNQELLEASDLQII